METQTNAVSRKPRRWLRWVGIVFGVLVVLLVVGYFVGTSEWALKSVILPKVSKAMNAEVTVEGASISPFSSVNLIGLKVTKKGTDPVVTAKEVRLRYSLMDIIKGNLNVSEVTLESPTVNLITFADSTFNLPEPADKDRVHQKKKEPKEKKEEKAPKLNLQKLTLKNATVRLVNQLQAADAFPLDLVELSGLNITVENLGNDRSGKIAIDSLVKVATGLNASNGAVAAKIFGSFDIALDSALKPKTVKGQTKVDVTEGKGAFAQVNALGVVLNTDVTPTQLNDVSVRLSQSGKNLGAITASGPFSAETMEGKINVAISGIDKQALNLVGGALGIDFNQTTINSTNTVELTQKGRVVSVNGALLVGSFGVTQKGQTTPTMDIRTSYAVTMDQSNKTAMVQTFALSGTQGGSEFLRGTLAKPMALNLGASSGAVDESAFDLVITNFNLPDWQAFIGTNATISSGKLAVTLNLISKQAGKNLGLTLATRLSALTAVVGSNRIDNADIAFDMKGAVQDSSVVKLDSYAFQLARGGQKALSATGALAYNTKTQDADVQADLDVVLPQVASLVVVPGLNVQSGTVKFAGHIVQKNTTPAQTNKPVMDRAIVGKLNLANFTGALQSNRFDRFATAVDLDVAMRGEKVEIKKFGGSLQQSGQAGGSFDVSGAYPGAIAVKLVDLNQNTLKSFLAAALGEKQLETVAINVTANANLASPTDGSIKAELHVANLVVNDPSGAVPHTPLAIDLTADVAMAKTVYDIKAVQLALTKTDRADNKLNVAGHFDLTKSNAWTGNVKVTSDGLDLTTYYDLFAKKKDTNATQTAKTGGRPAEEKPAGSKPDVEPAPIKLPFSQFTQEMSIAKVFLREVTISNLVSKTSIENGHVNLNPFSMSLNGAPVSLTAALNLAVAGFEYDLNAKMDRVPVEPLVNTFAPEKRGQFKGDLIANAALKGAGVTGAGFKKNLGGNLGLTLTNANVQVTKYTTLQKILVPIAVALRVPQISESPLTWIDARIVIANGTANIESGTAESSAFRAGVTGPITINEVLTNSTLNKLPVDLALRRNIADAARLTPSGTAADQQFVAMPRFVSISGTAGDPKPEMDKIAVTRILASTIGGFVGGDAGKLLKGLGNLGASGTTNQAAGGTNAGPATTSPAGNLLQSLPGLFDKQPKPPRTNAAPNQRRRQQ